MANKFQSEVLHLRKEDILVQLTSLKDYAFQPANTEVDYAIILDEVKTLKTLFQTLKLEIFKYNAKVSEMSECVKITDFPNFDETFREIIKKCSVTQHRDNSTNLTPIENYISLPLEKLNLYSWDGNISEWSSWYGMFSCTVDANPALTPTQKFLYLKHYLRGEPLAICNQLEINDPNYFTALELLKERYQNDRRLGSYYLSQLTGYLKNNSLGDLSNFLTIHRSSVAALKNLSGINDLANFCFFYLAYNNLDYKLQQAFDMSRVKGNNVPTFEELLQFVQFATINQELKSDITTENKKENLKFRPKPKFKRPVVGIVEEKNKSINSINREKSCPQCAENHRLYLCDHFKAFKPEKRLELVKKWKRCFNCLSYEHSPCPSKLNCFVCHQPHHTLLHLDSSLSSPKISSTLIGCATNIKKQILLGTLVCKIKDNFNNFVSVRCLCDSGAQTSLITLSLVKKLGLPYNSNTSIVQGLSSVKISTLGRINLILQSVKQNKSSNLLVTATIIRKVCGDLPSFDAMPDIRKNFDHLPLADDNFFKSSKIDIILGADTFPQLLSFENPILYKDEKTGLIAQNTIFGYIIQGAVSNETKNYIPEILYSNTLEETVQKFWETEEVTIPTVANPDDNYCERLFTTTTKRLLDGRFSVRLPFKPGAKPEKLKNKNLALINFQNLFKRLNKNEKLLKEYMEQINSYLSLRHMSLKSEASSSYILPQLLVMRESSLTTKMRICFNASALAYGDSHQNRLSLNDLLLPGPKLQSDLTTILTKFRLNPVGLIADVEMMFRMIEVHPQDRKYLHIFFQENSSSDLQELELNVLPFGLRCSPYLAQRAVQELLNLDGHLYPEAAHALRGCLYVDDFVGSSPSVKHARKLKEDLCRLMQRGGFNLRKWASSHPEVLENTLFEKKGKIRFDDETRTVKVLGLEWDAIIDSFLYKIINFDSTVSKRTCLSYIARTFDCLGLVCPVVFWMKLFLQKLWTLKLDWDDPLPDNLKYKWTQFVEDMSILRELKIPRCVFAQKPSDIYLACFSDGSQSGYAACVYLVVQYNNGDVSSNLLAAKSKLAPLRTISIPRLELCGALLMTQLCRHTLQALEELHIKSIFLFTDSQIVLAWVRTPPYQLKTFVANRITKIQEYSSGMHWSYVPTAENPSDAASRGLFPSKLISNSLWWAGPNFLKEDPKNWIRPPENFSIEIPELKNTTILMTKSDVKENPIYTDFLIKYSRLEKLQRVLGYVLRFIYNCKNSKLKRRSGPLTPSELNESLIICVRISQQQDFPDEIKALKGNKSMSSKLSKLNPYLDVQGVLRVGGRLTNSLMPEQEKHPILLSKNSHLSALLCDYYHRILLHSGPRTTRAMLQRKFWILAGHSLTRKIIHKCLRCFRWQGKPLKPMMGDLPSSRVRVSRCFSATTLDMAGPFITRESLRRKSPQHKSYLCVFVCEATKAVHLEGVTELSTPAFLAAFHRFVSRRSLPHLLRSDNGRNFIGARRTLKECQKFLEENQEEIMSALSARNVIWKLNPAHGPNFGGLHEAAVKSAKLLFYKTVGDAVLTFEEFTTLLARIEAVLNSRPISFVSTDLEDGIDYLSPGHFLVGGPLVSIPEEPLDLNITLHNRWIMVQQLSQRFWRRFQQEYLHTLLQREKWTRNPSNLTLGQLVYIAGDKTSPLTWPIGRVVELYPGADGIVRVADIKTSAGIYRRPVNKLVLIPNN